MGVFEKSTWQADGEHFTSYDLEGPAEVQLEDQASGECEVFGPFDFVRMANSTLWTNGGIFVSFKHETQHWQHIQTNTYWPEMVIKAP